MMAALDSTAAANYGSRLSSRSSQYAGATTKRSVRIESFFLVVAMIFFGKVWIWPIDVESQIELYKPFGYALRVAFVLIIPYSVYVLGYIVRPLARFPTSIFILLLLICWMSLLWTTQFITTFQNCLDLTCLVLTALLVSQRMTLNQILKVVFYASLSVIFISVLTSVLHLEFAIMGGVHLGRWRGLFGHKNNFAEFVLFSSIVAMFIPKDVGIKKSHYLAFFALALVSFVFSQSSTSVAVFAIAVSLRLTWPVVRSISRNKILTIVLILLFVYLANTVVVYYVSVVLDLLGRDITFTGRTLIWSHYFDVSLRMPYFGTGYGAFFTDTEVTKEARSKLFAIIRTPHNGYIALALGVGWVGVAIYAFWHASLIWLGITSQLGRISGMIFALALCYAVFSMFEVSGAAMIAFGLQILMVLSCAAIRDTIPRPST